MNIDIDKFKEIANYKQKEELRTLLSCEIKPVDCNECSEPKEANKTMTNCAYCVNNPHFENNFKPKTKEWYEKPLSFPVLCWVNDDNYNSKDTVALITSFLKTDCLFIESSQNNWMYATPLTKEELLNYCVGENESSD